MKVLSWDVGILNLSFCLIDFNKDTKEWKILDWDIINLTNREKIKCITCGANPSLYQEINNTKIYTCKNHIKQINCIPPKFEELYKPFTETEECSFKGKIKCCKKGKYLYNQKPLCNSHAKSEYKKICNCYQLKEYSKKSVKTIDLGELRLKLIKTLDTKTNLLQADTVVIENQPTLKNPRMKAISSTVYDYYLIRGIVDKDNTKSNIFLVKYMCPSNKLKLADDGDTQKLIKLKGDEAKTYKLTKSLAIKYCTDMVKKYPEWLNKINSFKKKDDMADSFLQGMYYLLYQ